MKLISILQAINEMAKKSNLSQPWIVGGAVRDKVMGKSEKIADIDITTGNEDIYSLARNCAVTFEKVITDFKVMNDFHSRMIIGDWKIDFSSNFNIPNVNSMLKTKGVQNITPLKEEVYSRDFNCNSLLWSLNLKEIKDLTNKGISDIKNRVIQTCLEPNITFGEDPKRVARAIYLSSKLNFNLSNETFLWIKSNPTIISEIKQDFLVKKINKALEYNKNSTLKLIDALNIWNQIPATSELIPYMKGQRI